jgi:hypothetical protein
LTHSIHIKLGPLIGAAVTDRFSLKKRVKPKDGTTV